MRYNNDGMSRVLNKLNENSQAQSIEAEPTIGVDANVDLHQCPECSGIYKGEPKSCPICGAAATKVNENRRRRRSRKVNECDDPDCADVYEDEDLDKDDDLDAVDPIQEDDELPKDVKVEVNEAMRLLSKGNYKKFNENYKDARMLRGNRVNLLVESQRTGRIYSVVRRVNAVQKANFKLVESMGTKVSRRANTNARLESARIARASLAALTEMNTVRIAAAKMLERQGVHYNHTRFNEAMKSVVNRSAMRFRKKFEAISDDKETGSIDFTEVTPEEISADVTEVIKDAGLEVLTQEVDAAPDSAAVQVRVQDNPDVEVNLQDIADTVSEVMDVPVAVVGPSVPEGDSTLADVTVLVNPDDELVEDSEKVALSESLRRKMSSRRMNENRRYRKRRVNECDDPMVKDNDKFEEEEDDDKLDYPKLSERRRSSRRRKLKESWIGGLGSDIIRDLKGSKEEMGSLMDNIEIKQDPENRQMYALYGSKTDLKKVIESGYLPFDDIQINEDEDLEQKAIDAEYDNLDAEEDELKADKKLSEKKRVRKIKEADDADEESIIATTEDDDDDDDKSKITITEEDDDDEETKDLIDQAKKLEEKIRRSRRRARR